jgi:peptidoglycan/LPS O-acetylase OafA/YrhL
VQSIDAEPDAAESGHPDRQDARHRREPALDGLRAMAALMVALLHCLFAVGMPGELREQLVSGPAGAVANGTSAVILFFVLSGYVLAGSFGREVSPRAAAVFLVKRLLRIYPAYVAAVAAAWIASFVYPSLGAGAGVGSSVHVSMAAHPGFGELLRHLVVPGTAGLLLPQGWTLPIELVLSFVLPLLFVLALRVRGAVLLALAATGLVLSDAAPIEYGFPFVLGVLASIHGWRNWRALSGASATALLLAAATLFFLPAHRLWSVSPDFGIVVVSGSALVLVLRAGTSAPLRKLFGSFLAVRLGRISYGFYLLHYTVLALVAPLVLPGDEATTVAAVLARWLLLAALVVPASALVAAASWRWIEAPAIAAGRRAGATISPAPRPA